MDDQNGSVDRELGAFLGREASRRTAGRRSDRDVVAAIVAGRTAPLRLPRALVAAGTAAFGLAVVVAVLASGLMSRPAGLASASPSIGYQAPFGMPSVPPGAACPVTDRWLIGTDSLPLGAAIGGAPVYAFLAESGHPAYFESMGVGNLGYWQRIDALWVAGPGFRGEAVIRAARLDGPGDVSFGDITERVPSPTLGLDGSHGQSIGTDGWTVIGQVPLLVRGPGCYGIQIETAAGSTVSVFEARPIEEAYEQLEQRPLRLPSAASGEGCPVTPISGEIKFRGWLVSVHGDGPVYVAGPGGTPMIWVADSRELGPIVIRGGRIDAPGELRFDIGTESNTVLRLPIHSYVESAAALQPAGWRQYLSSLQPSPPGCYAAQVDTLSGSQILVFELGP
jgi:hypothetical protein